MLRSRFPLAVRPALIGLLGVAALTACADDGETATGALPATTAATAASTGRVGAAEGVRLDGVEVEVRRDPGCGCCMSWVEYLERAGATVDVSDDPDRATFRSELGIDDDLASCHTAVVDGYAIEGHVPAGAIRRLLDERPDAVGLALAGMPVDSPGMGGDADAWAQLPVMLVTADGEATPFPAAAPTGSGEDPSRT